MIPFGQIIFLVNSRDLRDGFGIEGLIILISVLHYSTDITLAYFHDIYKILYYIPIILSAFRFGIRGGLVAAVTISLIYTPHVVHDWGGHFAVMVNRFVEMVIYIVVGFITGRLVENERAERRRYEQAAHALQESYEKLRQQAEEIAEIEEQLRIADRLAILGELTASLAHEVRNPLGAIKGAAEILYDEYPAGGKNREFVELLLRDVERINEVIENYLSLVAPSPRPGASFDVVEATRTVARILQGKARKENKHLHVRLPSKPLIVAGEENRFRQVVLNLVFNSFAAVAPGGHINVMLAADSNAGGARSAELSVQDDGVGIAPENLEKVFKPFFTTRKNGTGLGLAISRRIAEQHGWELSLESEPGRGTVARLVLPIAEREHEKANTKNSVDR